jgi:opacity protein-like surface antigen
MKRFTTIAAAAALALASFGSAAMAQPYQPYSPGPGYDHHDHGPGYGDHHWRQGDRFYGDRNRVDWRYLHLRPPPRGYEWVQDGRQYVLIGIASGVIADVLLNR